VNRTKINAFYLKEGKKVLQAHGITRSEIRGSENYLSIAHRHKKRWYYGREWLLADFRQIILITIEEHQGIEYDRKATEELFMRLRGPELTCLDEDDRLIYERIS
jgi:hypothetical protein